MIKHHIADLNAVIICYEGSESISYYLIKNKEYISMILL